MTASPAAPPADALPALADLQRGHAALSERVKDHVLAGDHPDRIAALVDDAVKLGAALDDKDERAAAQAIINFWTARLESAARDARREAIRQTLQGGADVSTAAPELRELGNTLLAAFDSNTLRQACAAADKWIRSLNDDQTTVRRLLLRLVRLRPNELVFDVVPTSRAALRDIDPAADAAPSAGSNPLPLNTILSELARTGVIRVTAGKTPETDQIALRSAALLTDWEYYRADVLGSRTRFRAEAEEWYNRTEVSQSAVTRVRRAAQKNWQRAVAVLGWIGDRVESGFRWLWRSIGLSTTGLLTGPALDEGRAYHDRNDVERLYVVKSRYREVEGAQTTRVLAGVFGVLVCAALVGWAVAVAGGREAWIQKEAADRSGRQMQIQRDALRMQAEAERASSLALSLILVSESEGVTHAAKKLLVIQALGHVLFSQDADRERALANWRDLKNRLTDEKTKPPAWSWFRDFFDTNDLGFGGRRVGYQQEVDRVTTGRPDREAVESLRTISSELRPFIVTPYQATARSNIAKALGDIRPVVFEQLTQVADQITVTADTGLTAADIQAFRNVYWRLYTCEVILLQSEDANDRLRLATEAFARALWDWEESPDGKASPETVAKLKQARDQVRDACNQK